MNAVIIDDERLAIEELSRLLVTNTKIDAFEGFWDAKEGLSFILRKEPDIAFIDINMPYLSGTSLAKEISERSLKTKIVFVTAYDDYAVEAFELEVLDYVLKPISKQRINQAIDKVEKYLVEKWKGYSNSFEPRKRLAVWTNESIKLVAVEDVICFEVVNKKLMVMTKDGLYEMTESLATILTQLDKNQFCQCYKSIVVNLSYIERISPMFNQTYEIQLKGVDRTLPVSRHYGTRMREILGF